jgi:hypothetical protein
MDRIDLRTFNKTSMKSSLIFAGYSIDEEHVKEMLQFMGVKADDDVIRDAIGFFSAHAIEFNMINLRDYLTERGIMKKTASPLKKN